MKPGPNVARAMLYGRDMQVACTQRAITLLMIHNPGTLTEGGGGTEMGASEGPGSLILINRGL